MLTIKNNGALTPATSDAMPTGVAIDTAAHHGAGYPVLAEGIRQWVEARNLDLTQLRDAIRDRLERTRTLTDLLEDHGRRLQELEAVVVSCRHSNYLELCRAIAAGRLSLAETKGRVNELQAKADAWLAHYQCQPAPSLFAELAALVERARPVR